jgi:hypothetical protein
MVWHFGETFCDWSENKNLHSASFNYTDKEKEKKLCSSCRFEGTSGKDASNEGVGDARLQAPTPKLKFKKHRFF